jgi:hypothetical protein
MKTIRNIILITVFMIAPAAWMTMSVLKEAKVGCKVCMSFNGNQNCGVAEGTDQRACVSTARDNACATIVRGMAEVIQCSQKEPLTIDYK